MISLPFNLKNPDNCNALRAVEEATDTNVDTTSREIKCSHPITKKHTRHRTTAIRNIAKNSLNKTSNGLVTAAARVPKDVPTARSPEIRAIDGPEHNIPM